MLHVYASSSVCHIFQLDDTIVIDVSKAIEMSEEYLENGTTVSLCQCPLFGIKRGAGLNQSQAKEEIKRIISLLIKKEEFLAILDKFLQNNGFDLHKPASVLRENLSKYKLRVEC